MRELPAASFSVFSNRPLGSPSGVFNQDTVAKRGAVMRTTDLSVTEILYSCGFNDPSYFSRQFKLRYGVTLRTPQNCSEERIARAD